MAVLLRLQFDDDTHLHVEPQLLCSASPIFHKVIQDAMITHQSHAVLDIPLPGDDGQAFACFLYWLTTATPPPPITPPDVNIGTILQAVEILPLSLKYSTEALTVWIIGTTSQLSRVHSISQNCNVFKLFMEVERICTVHLRDPAWHCDAINAMRPAFVSMQHGRVCGDKYDSTTHCVSSLSDSWYLSEETKSRFLDCYLSYGEIEENPLRKQQWLLRMQDITGTRSCIRYKYHEKDTTWHRY